MKIAEPLFPNDDGLADPHLLAALVEGSRYGIVGALAKSRVFVALLADLDSSAVLENGQKTEQESHMLLTWLVVDGAGSDVDAKALPIFSSMESLMAWNSVARPLGVEAQRAAIVALGEGGIAVLDPGSEQSHVIGSPALRSLALGYAYLPPGEDELLSQAIEEALLASVGPEHEIRFSLDGVDQLEITLYCGRPIPSQMQLSNFAAKLAADDRVRLRLETGLEIKIAGR
ncbi:MAG TPA: SseB family protein [Candidatus Nanopelagicaceae bacterium]|nr:SseB family protein [Candidatus Nanopelagicaceae bacterium]